MSVTQTRTKTSATSELGYQFDAPYVIFLGASNHANLAKTAQGIVDWAEEKCVGQISLAGCAIDLGLQELTIAQARDLGAKTLIIGVAPIGGAVDESWISVFREARQAGLTLVSGLHARLSDDPRLHVDSDAPPIIDIRTPPTGIPIANGRKRTGKRLLTVGTDCAVGKKYTALALTRDMLSGGLDARFCATGQTGIMIAGRGIPIDATVSDFTAGAAELLTPDAAPDHWDIVEGQGSLFHPAYAGVSLSLLHGTQPDAIVLCHEAGRERITFFEQVAVPDIATCIARNLEAGALTNPMIQCVGISVNCSAMAAQERRDYLRSLEDMHQIPAVDALADGTREIVDFMGVNLGRDR